MQAFRVWSTFDNDPDDDAMSSAAFQLRSRADELAKQMNADHLRRVGQFARCQYEVREETVPRDFVFQGKADRVVLVILGSDNFGTDVSSM